MAAEYVEVCCVVLPSGNNLWFETSKGSEYLGEVLRKWKAEHPEYGEPCNAGAVIITMPKDKYIAIGASSGPGCFEFP